MNTHRRTFIKSGAAAGMVSVAAAAGLLRASEVLASDWNKSGFEARTVPDTLRGLGVDHPLDSAAIFIKAPDIAETGANVPIDVTSRIAGTQSISLLVDNNPQPLAADVTLGSQAEGYVATRVKMGASSTVRVLVRANGKVYTATRDVKVTLGGCGGGGTNS